jgi:agmatine deiminase
MPAEWEPHEATWLAWPHEISDWPGKFAPIPWVYGEIVRHLSRVEKVRILVDNPDVEEKARRILSRCHVDLAAVQFFRIKTDRSWTRDFCPTFVKNKVGQSFLLNWQFNGWAKYNNAANDDAVTTALSDQLRNRNGDSAMQPEEGGSGGWQH